MCWCLSSYHSLLATDWLFFNGEILLGVFLPREFSVIMVRPAYILPGVNANETLHEFHNAISDQKNDPPRGFFSIVAGAFNHTRLKPAVPKFYQQHFSQHCQKGREYVWPILLQQLWLTQSRPCPPPGSFLPPLCFSSQHTDHCSNSSRQLKEPSEFCSVEPSQPYSTALRAQAAIYSWKLSLMTSTSAWKNT